MNKLNVILLFALVLSHQVSGQQSEVPPNIILMMADDLGYGDVGFNGNENIITPHLDEMAASGMVFDHFYAAAPLCSPTRASCLTGRSPFRQGIFAAHTGGMRISETTLAEILEDEGYSTGFFGKWHIGWVEPEEVQTRGFYSPPWQHGYHEVFATRSAVPTWNPTQTPPNWNGFGAREDGSWGGSVYVQNGQRVKDNLEGDDSRIIMDRVLPFIEEASDANQPFFATVWFHTPHEPVYAGPEYLKMYPDLPEKQKHLYGCITAMDEQIGRLRRSLREQGIAKNTIIFFCSDNGPADPLAKKGIASAGPFRGHKHQLWEGGIRVPSLIEWPGKIKTASVSSFQAGTVDYLPTILDILGISMRKKVPIDGVSLLPAIEGNEEQRSVPLAFGYQRLYKDIEIYAFIQGNYKICIPEEDASEMMLFNLEQDPAETENLAGSEPELLRKMETELEEIKASWRLSREGADYTW
mgnify:FL=1